jgi:hypothetical protein
LKNLEIGRVRRKKKKNDNWNFRRHNKGLIVPFPVVGTPAHNTFAAYQQRLLKATLKPKAFQIYIWADFYVFAMGFYAVSEPHKITRQQRLRC